MNDDIEDHDLHVWHKDRHPLLPLIMQLTAGAKTASEEKQWLKDGLEISQEEGAFRASALSYARRKWTTPEKSQKQIRRENQARANRFKGNRRTSIPENAFDFMRAGGMDAMLRKALSEVRKDTIRFEREFWLAELERFLAEGLLLPDDTVFTSPFAKEGTNYPPESAAADRARDFIKGEIRRLRSALGIKHPRRPLDAEALQRRRANTRERVRRFRAQQG
jgi:hypothetical protein